MKFPRIAPACAPALAIGLLVGATGCAGSSPEPSEPEEPAETAATDAQPVEAAFTMASLGQPAPDFELDWLNHDGGETLADLRGRVVLIEFWRTW